MKKEIRFRSKILFIALILLVTFAFTACTVPVDEDLNCTENQIEENGECVEKEPVQVPDTVLPIISGFQNMEFTIGESEPNYLDGISASDDVDGDITENIIVDSTLVDFTAVGEYTVILTVWDSSQNQRTESFTISVKENIPVISFIDYDGSVISSYELEAGSSIKSLYPEPLNREGFSFGGWDKIVDVIGDEDITITARYAEIVDHPAYGLYYEIDNYIIYSDLTYNENRGAIKIYKKDDATYERIIDQPNYLSDYDFVGHFEIIGNYLLVHAFVNTDEAAFYVYKFDDPTFEQVIETESHILYQLKYRNIENDTLFISGYINEVGTLVRIYDLTNPTHKREMYFDDPNARIRTIYGGEYFGVFNNDITENKELAYIYSVTDETYERIIVSTSDSFEDINSVYIELISEPNLDDDNPGYIVIIGSGTNDTDSVIQIIQILDEGPYYEETVPLPDYYEGFPTHVRNIKFLDDKKDKLVLLIEEGLLDSTILIYDIKSKAFEREINTPNDDRYESDQLKLSGSYIVLMSNSHIDEKSKIDIYHLNDESYHREIDLTYHTNKHLFVQDDYLIVIQEDYMIESKNEGYIEVYSLQDEGLKEHIDIGTMTRRTNITLIDDVLIIEFRECGPYCFVGNIRRIMLLSTVDWSIMYTYEVNEDENLFPFVSYIVEDSKIEIRFRTVKMTNDEQEEYYLYEVNKD